MASLNLGRVREDLRHSDQVDGAGRDLRSVFGITPADPAVYIPLVMAEIRRRCNNNGEIDGSGVPNYRGILIGDYIDGLDFSGVAAPPTSPDAPQAWNDTYKNNRIVVSGFNTYKGYGLTENTQNHILFTFRNCIARGRMNSTNDNTGGYPASELRIWLEGSAGDLAGATFGPALQTRLGGQYLYGINKYHGNKFGPVYNVSNWFNYTVFLASELEVMGYQTYGDDALQYNTNVQFPIYSKSGAYRIKRWNGSRQWWWEQTAWNGTTAFCGVGRYGFATCNVASSVTGGVAPCFCVR